MVTVREIKNYDEFTSFINMENDILHVVKIGAEWCGPCRVLENTISNLEPERINGVLFGKVDIDDDGTENIAEEYNIRNIPVMLFIKNGELLDRKVGGINSNEIYNTIEKLK